MKKVLPKLGLWALGTLLLTDLIFHLMTVPDLRKDIKKKQAAYDELQEEKQKIETECSATEATKKELETKVAEQETALAEKDKTIADRDAQIKKLNQEITNLKK